ncbi:MAG: tetratricopeptide repeat protein [Muribaculaceae bacterium]|nr:tetratricopeptide repeat protein [Muribaculaceae bacterium]
MNSFTKAFAAIFFMLTCVGSAMLGAKTSRYDDEADARKADYIFLEALKYSADSKDAYYDLVERAYELNPSDKYLGMEYGCKMMMELGDSVSLVTGLGLVKDYVMSEPSDLYAGTMFAAFADHLGRPEEAVDAMAMMHYAHPERADVAKKYVDVMITHADTVTMFDQALRLIDTLERAEGINPELSMRRMRIYEVQADTASIKEEMLKLLNSSPSRPEYNTFAGQIYLGLGNPDSAKVFFDRAVELDPTNGEVYYNRASFYNQIGDSVAYDREVFQAMLLPDIDIEPKLEILRDYVIKLFRDSTQTERLTSLFRGLVDRYPHEPKVRNLYADYLIAIQDFPGAAEQKSYELDMVPGDERAWVVLSSLYLQSNEYDKSVNAVERGLHYFPEAISLYEIGSAAELNRKDNEAALQFIRRGMEVADTTDVEIMSRLVGGMGDIMYNMEHTDSAFVLYNRAIELDPENLTALNNCAYYLACNDRDLDRALSLIERVVAQREDDPTSLDTYAWVLFKMKNYAKAHEVIDEALANSEEVSSDLYDHAGDIYFMDGDPESALDFWEKALKLDPDNQMLKRKVKHKTFFYK